MNPVQLKFYPFVISVDRYTRSCNNVLSLKICVPKETKDINVKAFDMITNKNEAKAMTKLISCDCKWKLNSSTFSSNQKWNNNTGQCERKKYHECKKDYSCNLSMYLWEK